MKITYNAEGGKRKELVNAVSKLLAVDSVYQGPPSFAYTVDGYTIDRQGNLQTPEEATKDDIFLLTDALFAEYGFKAEEQFDELFPDEAEPIEDEAELEDTSDAAELNEQDDADEAESVVEDEDEDADAVCDSEPDEDDEVDEGNPIEDEEVTDEAEQDEDTDDADDIAEDETEEEADDSDEESTADAQEESEEDSVEAPETAPVAAETVGPEDDTGEAAEAPENGESAPETGEEAADPEAPLRLTLSLPREKFSPSAIDRLRALVMSKQTLLKKVFETDDLSIVTNDTQIMFPWFTLHGIDGEVDTYAKFIHAIAVRALTSSRISAYEKPTDNDKFTMRLFLNNLGFKGEEYKFARRFLVRNLEGNGAWRYGNAPDASGFDLELPTVFTPAAPAQETAESIEGEADPEEENVENEEESTDEE